MDCKVELASLMFSHLPILVTEIVEEVTPHICHNHHNRWLCKSFESSVKFSIGYMKESALSVISYRLCNLTHTILYNV